MLMKLQVVMNMDKETLRYVTKTSLFIKGLIFHFELFKIHKMKSSRKLVLKL